METRDEFESVGGREGLAKSLTPQTPTRASDSAGRCSNCGVPLDVHGTVCGWRNAKVTVSNEGKIMDKRHPSFGLDYNEWMNGFRSINDEIVAVQISRLTEENAKLQAEIAALKEARRPINIENQLKWFIINAIDRLEREIHRYDDDPDKGQTHIGLSEAIRIIKELRDEHNIPEV